MTKKNIMPVAVLVIICVVVAALLGGVNMLTKDKIAENALKKEQASLIEVMPGAALFEEIEAPAGAPETVKTVYRETSGLGYVLVMATRTSYSNADMAISVGISNGEVVGAKITNYAESKDIGKTTYPGRYIGTTLDDYSEVDTVSGATVSSTAFRAVIGDALETEKLLSSTVTVYVTMPSYMSSGETLPKNDTELAALLAQLVPDATFTETALPETADSTLKKIYSVSSGGYVAYIVVPGAYVPVATEALVYVDTNGDIKNINLLQWVVGHGVEPGDFAEGFIGNDIYHIDDVELVSQATYTALDFKNAVTMALGELTSLMDIEEKVWLDLVDEKIPNSGEIVKLDLPADAPSTLKALYKDTTGRGTVAHIVVPGAYVPVATEALVYFDNFGTIRGIDLRKWIVGHGVEPGDFAQGFIGKNAETVKEVELVTAATVTAEDFRDAVENAFPYVPVAFPIWRVVGILAISLAAAAYVAYEIIYRKRRALK